MKLRKNVKLVIAMKMRGITVKVLATAIGVSPSTVHGWRRGFWRPLSERQRRIAEILGVEVHWLFEADGKGGSDA